MRHWAMLAAWLSLGFAVGCVSANEGHATLQGTDPASKLSGTATFSQTPQGVKAVVKLTGAPAGVHGFHIHEHGSCEDAAKAAGSHFNPENTKHGFLPKDGLHGAHAGDMGNITVDKDGRGSLTLDLAGLTLDEGPHGIAGRSVVVHEKADDFGQPTGNAGGRIGCGVILATNPQGEIYKPQ